MTVRIPNQLRPGMWARRGKRRHSNVSVGADGTYRVIRSVIVLRRGLFRVRFEDGHYSDCGANTPWEVIP